MPDTTISSSEFQSHPGVYMDSRDRVYITKYRRPVKVLVDVADLERLEKLAKYRPTREAVAVENLTPEEIHAIRNADLSHLDPELDKLMS